MNIENFKKNVKLVIEQSTVFIVTTNFGRNAKATLEEATEAFERGAVVEVNISPCERREEVFKLAHRVRLNKRYNPAFSGRSRVKIGVAMIDPVAGYVGFFSQLQRQGKRVFQGTFPIEDGEWFYGVPLPGDAPFLFVVDERGTTVCVPDTDYEGVPMWGSVLDFVHGTHDRDRRLISVAGDIANAIEIKDFSQNLEWAVSRSFN
jgi:hypothetical protein